jgi:hypothetical protein
LYNPISIGFDGRKLTLNKFLIGALVVVFGIGTYGSARAQSFYDNFAGATGTLDNESTTFQDSATESSGDDLAYWKVEPQDPASLDVFAEADTKPGDYAVNIGIDPTSNGDGLSLKLNDNSGNDTVGITPGNYELSFEAYVGDSTDNLDYYVGSMREPAVGDLDAVTGLNSATWIDVTEDVTVGSGTQYLGFFTTDTNKANGYTSADDVDITDISLRRQATPEPIATALAVAGAVFGFAMLRRKNL